MFARTITPTLLSFATEFPVVTITGPRQSGKTTLCRTTFPDKPYINLEQPETRQFAKEDPKGFLATIPDGAVLDEIQRVPDLLSYIQVLVDDKPAAGRFILTGSQQFEVMNTISQSLAGRTALLKLLPLSIEELTTAGVTASSSQLILNGFYPRIHSQRLNPTRVLSDYYETYVERDLRQLVTLKNIGLFEKFVRLCAGRVGQLLNLQGLGAEVGVSHSTAREWLTLLEASYVVFQLRPWHSNISKRLIKSPKIYFYDVGLASYLLGLETESHVGRDPLRGSLFENMAIIEALKYCYNRGKKGTVSFYRDSNGNEVDLLMEVGPDLFPVEIKSAETIVPEFFKGLVSFSKIAPKVLLGAGLVYGGTEQQKRTAGEVWPVTRMHEMLDGVYCRETV
ncbi:ATP-binding protein [Trichlorobacter lovleyi]|uniref:ATP-binding protein n=1 Tax=Trichlorobacter lovleyi TaxID=313985 RepID=UPI0023EFEE3B|nr:ATP-binding protein [Trichlorobacter lovleyi]